MKFFTTSDVQPHVWDNGYFSMSLTNYANQHQEPHGGGVWWFEAFGRVWLDNFSLISDDAV